MKVLAIVNNKGGVGKTTSAQNIGAALAKSGGRTLMIDLDAQASLTRSFGFSQEEVDTNVGSFILNEAKFEQVVLSNGLLDILPSSVALTAKEEAIKSAAVYPFNLKIALDKIKSRYDYVIIDCPPALSGLTRIALVACTEYFIPLQPEYLSYEGLRNFLQFANDIQQISNSILLGGVFATRYNPRIRKKLSHDLIASASEQLQDRFLQTYIRDNIALSEAQAKGINIFDYAPESNGATDYYNLTKEILERIDSHGKRK